MGHGKLVYIGTQVANSYEKNQTWVDKLKTVKSKNYSPNPSFVTIFEPSLWEQVSMMVFSSHSLGQMGSRHNRKNRRVWWRRGCGLIRLVHGHLVVEWIKQDWQEPVRMVYTSMKKPAINNVDSSFPMALHISSLKRCNHCFTGFAPGTILREFLMTFHETLAYRRSSKQRHPNWRGESPWVCLPN